MDRTYAVLVVLTIILTRGIVIRIEKLLKSIGSL